MRTKAGKQNKTLPSGRGPQLCPAGERHGGPFLPVKNKQETQPRGNAGEEYGPGPDAAAKAHVPPEITPCFLPTEDKAACTAVGHRGGEGASEQGRSRSSAYTGQVRIRMGPRCLVTGSGPSYSRGAVRPWAGRLTSLGSSPLLEKGRPQVPAKVPRN